MSDVIPFEVQMNIVKRVDDLNSLIRFRSVSKEWKSYIDSSEFIAGYGFRDTQPPRLMLRYLQYHEDWKEEDSVDEFGNITHGGTIYYHTVEKCICFVDNDDGFALQHEFVVPDLIQQLRDMKVVGTSHGLFCMHGLNDSGTRTIVVWNSSIRKSIGIVVPHVSHGTTIYGFGVPPITCDPTIIKISYDLANSTPWHAEIFTLSSKHWKVIPTSNLPRKSITLFQPDQVVIDRFIYWATHDIDVKSVADMKYEIMSFDLITHEFKEVHLPDSINNQVYAFLTVSKLRESLVVSAYVDRDVYGVWMMDMEDDGNVPSFKKLFNFDMGISSVNKILGFTKRGQPIAESRDEKFDDLDLVAIEVYEPWSEHKTNLGIYGMEYSFFMDSYGETLVLLDHSDGFIYSDMI